MADEALKETAATTDKPRAREKHPGNRLASGEFFYLAERIDRLDEKLTGKIENESKALNGRIDALDAKLTGKIESGNNALDTKMQGLDAKLTGEIRTLDAKLTSKIESEVRSLNDRFTATQQWMIGLVVAVLVGAGAIVITLLLH
jgi:hypothetical protein